jgi:LPS export ABC transporter protein LptC
MLPSRPIRSEVGFFIFCSLIIGLWTTGCSNSIEDIQKLSGYGEEQPDVVSENVEMTYSEMGKNKIVLKTPLLERFITSDEPQEIMPDGLEVVFLDSLGKPSAYVYSNYGIHFPDREILELQNDVRVFNIKNERLNTEVLIWDRKNEKIYSDDFVKITTEEETFYGDGFEADQDFKTYKIKHIRGILSIEDEDL